MAAFKASFYMHEGQLYFHLEREANTQPCTGLEFDGPATERHKLDYKSQYQAFLDIKKGSYESGSSSKTTGPGLQA